MITITYFGSLKQLRPEGSEALPWAGGTTEDLLGHLRRRGPQWAHALAPGRVFRVAVNRRLSSTPLAIADGDDVALLPPVTGG